MTAKTTPILRFAPSPTGRLHIGHALSAWLNVAWARRLSGRLLIRIEDTDLARCRPEHMTQILEDLAWIGIRSDGPILVQSEHLPVYEAAARRLAAMGLLYPCFATRQEIAAAAHDGAVDPDGAPIYPGLWRGADPRDVKRRTEAGEAFAMRLDMARALEMVRGKLGGRPLAAVMLDEGGRGHEATVAPERWGDVVIQRKDSPASYHLAVVVDDARQGVSHIVRGRDLLEATAIHRVLQVLLDLPAPVYHHHRLLTDRDGRKLSKRDGDLGLEDLRARGATADEVRRLVEAGFGGPLDAFTSL